MYELLNFNVLGFVSGLLSFCSWQDDLMESFVTQWFQEELLSECRAERERGNKNTLYTLLDSATEQFVELYCNTCNFQLHQYDSLTLTRYITKKYFKKTMKKTNKKTKGHKKINRNQRDA